MRTDLPQSRVNPEFVRVAPCGLARGCVIATASTASLHHMLRYELVLTDCPERVLLTTCCGLVVFDVRGHKVFRLEGPASTEASLLTG